MLSTRFYRPAQALRRFVQFYAQRELRLSDPLFVQPVPARPAPMLEFIFGNRVTAVHTLSGIEETSPTTVVVGMLTRPHVKLRLQGTLQAFVIVFHPSGLDELFPVASSELTNRHYDSRLVIGKSMSELEERLGECESFPARVRLMENLLMRRIPSTQSADPITTATRLMFASGGRIQMPNLASRIGVSQRQFERRFASRFGMRPKLFARTIRFQAALDSKARCATKSWTDVAHEFGYFDQMHLIHDFEEFTAGTPTETLRALEAGFREQIRMVRVGMGARDPQMVPRFVM